MQHQSAPYHGRKPHFYTSDPFFERISVFRKILRSRASEKWINNPWNHDSSVLVFSAEITRKWCLVFILTKKLTALIKKEQWIFQSKRRHVREHSELQQLPSLCWFLKNYSPHFLTQIQAPKLTFKHLHSFRLILGSHQHLANVYIMLILCLK